MEKYSPEISCYWLRKALSCVGYLTPYLEVVQVADYRCERSKTTFNLVS